MNTLIWYMYRDGCNYKVHHYIVVAGELTEAQLTEQMDTEAFLGDPVFIPEQVGLPGLQEQMCSPWDDEVDGPWHELYSVELTDREPDWHQTAEELLAAFTNAKEAGWDPNLCEAER